MEELREWLGVIIAGAGLVAGFFVWLLRLEGSTKTSLSEIARLERQMEADRRASADSRRETHDMLKEMRTDIKRLLERGAGG